MNIFGRSDIGKVRETNQDTFAFGQLTTDTSYLLVCDGMGGVNGGNVASQMARDVICNQIIKSLNGNMDDNSIRNLIEISLAAANSTIYAKAKSDLALKRMGTTAVLVIVSQGKVHIGHVGDSRAYILSNGQLYLLTRDHSWVQLLLENGKIKPEEMENHPQKHQLTRAIGVEPKVKIDYKEHPFNQNDIILLCTDGLTNSCTATEIQKIINESLSPEQAGNRLIVQANNNGGHDNITIVVAEYK